jgi:hypothetical protein
LSARAASAAAACNSLSGARCSRVRPTVCAMRRIGHWLKPGVRSPQICANSRDCPSEHRCPASIFGTRNVRLGGRDDLSRLDLRLGVRPENPLEQIVIGECPECFAMVEGIERPKHVGENVLIGIGPEHRPEPADESAVLMLGAIAAELPRRSGSRKRPTGEQRGGAAIKLQHAAGINGFGSDTRVDAARLSFFRLGAFGATGDVLRRSLVTLRLLILDLMTLRLVTLRFGEAGRRRWLRGGGTRRCMDIRGGGRCRRLRLRAGRTCRDRDPDDERAHTHPGPAHPPPPLAPPAR